MMLLTTSRTEIAALKRVLSLQKTCRDLTERLDNSKVLCKQQEKAIRAVLKILTKKNMYVAEPRCSDFNRDCCDCCSWKMFDLLTDALS